MHRPPLILTIACLVVIQAELPHASNADRSARGSIAITQVPPKGGGPDRMETIAGTVDGVDFKNLRVVIYARTNTWYVQPYAASPYTPIGKEGKWEAKTHLGDEYGALLVEDSYQPAPTTHELPEVRGQVLAVVRGTASNEAEAHQQNASATEKPRQIHFSGYEWIVKSSRGPVGPGPNYFSDSEENVSVDSKGRLHLRITNQGGRWSCAEIEAARHLGYGSYRFYLDSDAARIDRNVVLGMFTWSDNPAYAHREIDIEVSRWGKAENSNGQFVVQPYTRPMNIFRFEIPPGVGKTRHSFDWRADRVDCESRKAGESKGLPAGFVISKHTFTHDIPPTGDERARINLWLVAGKPPAGDKVIEVIISRFEFVNFK